MNKSTWTWIIAIVLVVAAYYSGKTSFWGMLNK